MHDEEKLRQQMAQIGARYLTRTLGELRRISELVAAVQGGATTELKELEHAAHKIHGSGAMFGFDEVSDRAGEIEHIAGHLARRDLLDRFQAISDDELRRRLGDAVRKLGELTQSAARELGIDTNGS